MKRTLLAFFALLVMPFCARAQATAPSSPSPESRIAASRSQLFTDGSLHGSGAATLRSAAASASYVFLGEDHGEREIPRFADALYGALVPQGYDTIAVEMGPAAAQMMERWVREPGGAQAYASFEKRFPGTIAFYGWRDEWSFLTHAAARTGPAFHLIGLDQELMGSPGFLLTSIQAQHPGPASSRLVATLLAKNDAALREAEASNDLNKLFMLRVPESDLVALRSSLSHDGNARAQQLAQGLLDSYRIYANCCNENSARSNSDRATLMKQTLLRDERAHPHRGKIFFKFGGEHGYRGFNPLENNDIGNFLTERAAGEGRTGLHVLILGVGGEQTGFAGFRPTYAAHPYDLLKMDDGMFGFLAPFVAQLYPDGLTMFDLHAFRTHFLAMGISDPGFRKLVWAYDYLILVPKTLADPPLDPGVL